MSDLSHNVPPRLPTELLNEILALVNRGAPPVERQLNRQRFMRVCRDWHASVDAWKEVAVVGLGSLVRLQGVLEGDGEVGEGEGEGPVGRGIRTLWVGLGEVRPVVRSTLRLEAAEEDMALPATSQAAALSALRAVARLPELGSLTLAGVRVALDAVPADPLDWPALNSLAFRDCSVRPSPGPATPTPTAAFPRHAHLRSLALDVVLTQPTLNTLIAHLPPALTSLSLHYRPARSSPENRLDLPWPALRPLAPRLTALTLAAPLGYVNQSAWAGFTTLRFLAIDDASATQLPIAAGALPALRHLALRPDRRLARACNLDSLARNVQRFVRSYAALETVELAAVTCNTMGADARRAVEAAAGCHGVRLVLSDRRPRAVIPPAPRPAPPPPPLVPAMTAVLVAPVQVPPTPEVLYLNSDSDLDSDSDMEIISFRDAAEVA